MPTSSICRVVNDNVGDHSSPELSVRSHLDQLQPTGVLRPTFTLADWPRQQVEDKK